MSDFDRYQTALLQIDVLISHLRQHQSADCAAAEEEDAVLIRLAAWKTGLTPDNRAAVAEIGRYYRRFVMPDGEV